RSAAERSEQRSGAPSGFARWGEETGLLVDLDVVDRARVGVVQDARQRAIGEASAFGLADGAVVGLVVGVADALHRLAAHRTRLAVAAVHREARSERGDVARPREAAGELRAQPVEPRGQRRAGRTVEAADLLVVELARLLDGRQPRRVQDLV